MAKGHSGQPFHAGEAVDGFDVAVMHSSNLSEIGRAKGQTATLSPRARTLNELGFAGRVLRRCEIFRGQPQFQVRVGATQTRIGAKTIAKALRPQTLIAAEYDDVGKVCATPLPNT
jgi:hypothetical protein